jgi:hypothetical protein
VLLLRRASAKKYAQQVAEEVLHDEGTELNDTEEA